MATPQDNYIVPGRASFIGQIGNIGSSNGLAGNSNNASIGGTVNNGVQSSNAAGVAAFAVVKTTASPSGMGAGGGGSVSAVSSSSSFPLAVQQDVAIDKNGIHAAQFTAGLASPASLGNNANFPSTNGVNVVLPAASSSFNKAASNVSISNTGAPKLTGITNTLTANGENDLTLTQVDNFGQAQADGNKKIGGAAQDGQLPPVPLNDPALKVVTLAGNRDNSSLLSNN